MSDHYQATLKAQVHGADGEARWLTGEYDASPLHVELPPELADRLSDDGRIGDEHLPRLTLVTTDKIERGEGRFGRRGSDGRGTLVLALTLSDWERQG